MDKQTRTEIEAAAWRKMLSHFQKRTDVQNIDLVDRLEQLLRADYYADYYAY